MFVLKSTYQKQIDQHRLSISGRIDKYNKLVDEYNSLLALYKKERNYPRLSNVDIKKMITLCHPDKHGGRDTANEITRKLIAMRK